MKQRRKPLVILITLVLIVYVAIGTLVTLRTLWMPAPDTS